MYLVYTMKRDPYRHRERYLNWKKSIEDGIPGISQNNSDLTKRYLHDMENGINVSLSNRKGARSYIRLNTLREKMIFFSTNFEKRFGVKDITKIKEDKVCLFFSAMKKGEIKRKDGKVYRSVADYVKVFKAFWHWWMKINKKKGIEIKDITEDLDTRYEKPRWVYLTEEQVKLLCSRAKYEYKVLIMFLFDSGIRAPTELVNIKVSDIYSDFKELHIRDEISKTFGRRIKLMLCSNLLKEYVRMRDLGPDDYIFNITPHLVNQYLKRLAKKVLGEEESPAGQKYSDLTMYDFRHCSCFYWYPRYKSESALKYRFGWKSSDKIHYYSELLGMKDTISEEDLLIDVTKTELEKRLAKTEKEKEVLKERISMIELKLKKVLQVMNEVYLKAGC